MKIVKVGEKTLAHVSRDEWLKIGLATGWSDEYGLTKESATRVSDFDEAQKIISGITEIERRLNNTIKALTSMTKSIDNAALQQSHQEVMEWINKTKKNLDGLKVSYLTPKVKTEAVATPKPKKEEKAPLRKQTLERQSDLPGLELESSFQSNVMKKEAWSLFRKTQGTLFDAVVKEVVTINKLINSYFQKAISLSEKTRVPNLKQQMADFSESLKKVKIPAMEALEAIGEEDDMFEWVAKKEETSSEVPVADKASDVPKVAPSEVPAAPSEASVAAPAVPAMEAPAVSSSTPEVPSTVPSVAPAPEAAEAVTLVKNKMNELVEKFTRNPSRDDAKKWIEFIKQMDPTFSEVTK